MARRSAEEPKKQKKSHTAITPEGRENQVIALAYDLAEKQIRDGTATSQVITHFLKLGTKKEKLEQEILAEQKKLITAKTESLESMGRIEEMYKDAMRAFGIYQGNPDGGCDGS